MAFVSSFLPPTTSRHFGAETSPVRTSRRKVRTFARPTMKFVIDLSKYEELSKGGPADRNYADYIAPEKPTVDVPVKPGNYGLCMDKYSAMSKTGPAANKEMQPRSTSSPSSGWTKYASTVLEKYAPTRKLVFRKKGIDTYADMMTEMKAMSRLFIAPNGNPDDIAPMPIADAYMARCITASYKRTACSAGVYGVMCSEGTVKGAAEDSRVAALASKFRLSQRSAAEKYGDFTEARRKAIIAANGCSYEESLVSKAPRAGHAFVLGLSEAKRTCIKYAVAKTPEEQYMINSVDKQYKMAAVPYGVYGVLCSDGTSFGAAEAKRVAALATKFRAKQVPKTARTQGRYDAAMYARKFFRTCNYEADVFNKYKAVGAAMRPSYARY